MTFIVCSVPCEWSQKCASLTDADWLGAMHKFVRHGGPAFWSTATVHSWRPPQYDDAARDYLADMDRRERVGGHQ